MQHCINVEGEHRGLRSLPAQEPSVVAAAVHCHLHVRQSHRLQSKMRQNDLELQVCNTGLVYVVKPSCTRDQTAWCTALHDYPILLRGHSK